MEVKFSYRESKVRNVGLEFSETDSPGEDDFARFRDLLHDRKLSRSTINKYPFSIKNITKCSDRMSALHLSS